jgi:uncharacterized protein involved in cysteine biosynthesis
MYLLASHTINTLYRGQKHWMNWITVKAIPALVLYILVMDLYLTSRAR